jgi:hypothetical protein
MLPISLVCMEKNKANMSSVNTIIASRYRNYPEKEKFFKKKFLLIYDASRTGLDKFKDFYSKLKPKDRALLIKLSGVYNTKGKKSGWYCPEITEGLIEVYFQDDGLRNHIRSYFEQENKKDKQVIHNYFMSRLINNKGLRNNKTLSSFIFNPKKYDRFFDFMKKEIYFGSLFVNGGSTIRQDKYPISLNIGKELYKTYAIHFGSDNYEYRITGIDDKQCCLWVINQNNQGVVCSKPIKLNNPIKGYRLSCTNDAVEYAVIYSEHEIIHAKIDRESKSCIELTSVVIPENNTVIDICFDPLNNNWVVGFCDHKRLRSVLRLFGNNCTSSDEKTSYLINDHGLLQKMAIYKLSSGYGLLLLFGIANQRKIYACISNEKGTYVHRCYSDLYAVREYMYLDGYHMVNTNGAIEAFDLTATFFEKDRNQDINDNMVSSESILLSSKIHKVYSPNGLFLMYNALQKNVEGKEVVSTFLYDSETHQAIASFDMMSENFIGIGFSPDGNDLLIVKDHDDNPYSKISLWNDQCIKMLSVIEKEAFASSRKISLLQYLCEKYKKNGYIQMSKDDQICTMLKNWSEKSLIMLNALKQCLPVYIIQENTFRKTSIYERGF